MKQNLTASRSIVIDAPADKVWEALTNPVHIKQYLFGTNTITDWRPGSPVRWKGEYQGKTYEDRGKVISAEPGKILQYTYWSSMSGKEDKPENYAIVTNEITAEGTKTRLTITQDGNETEKSKEHAEQNWGMVLDGIEKVVATL